MRRLIIAMRDTAERHFSFDPDTVAEHPVNPRKARCTRQPICYSGWNTAVQPRRHKGSRASRTV
jgi:hypothetical protein